MRRVREGRDRRVREGREGRDGRAEGNKRRDEEVAVIRPRGKMKMSNGNLGL